MSVELIDRDFIMDSEKISVTNSKLRVLYDKNA